MRRACCSCDGTLRVGHGTREGRLQKSSQINVGTGPTRRLLTFNALVFPVCHYHRSLHARDLADRAGSGQGLRLK